MIEFKENESSWYFNGKNINNCNIEELKEGYKEFFQNKTQEELQRSLGFALFTENYVKAQVIKEIYGEKFLEPIHIEDSLEKYIKNFMNGTS